MTIGEAVETLDMLIKAANKHPRIEITDAELDALKLAKNALEDMTTEESSDDDIMLKVFEKAVSHA